jgi:hypothetical protein
MEPRRLRLFSGFLLAAAALGACSTMPDLQAGGSGHGRLTLERDFAGHFYAQGAFVGALSGARRPFTSIFDGGMRQGEFVLSERISFADGERDHVTWRFEKIGPGHYLGRREDVVGTADILADGRSIRLSYDVIVPNADKTQVHFEDVIERQADGHIVNRAIVSKYGVAFGRIGIPFSRNHP